MSTNKASAEHLELAKIVRNVHRDLRKLFAKSSRRKNIAPCETGNNAEEKKEILWAADDENELWIEHCRKEDVLDRYADAMHQLATVHWTKNNVTTRIDWCYNVIRDYFHGGGLHRELFRQSRRQLQQHKCSEPKAEYRTDFILPAKVRLLDVGSCYNPFGVYDDLDVLGVDLCPATKEVRRCDFLNLDITLRNGNEAIEDPFLTDVIERLPAKHFHVVVFSLLLEYLPTARQRYRCFVSASALLADRGLLLVVTPDSKHQTRNAAMIKSWRLGLESFGFGRIRYEKQPHLHCMAFVKMADHGHEDHQIVDVQLAEMFYIPQDFQECSSQSDDEAELEVYSCSRTAEEDSMLADGFSELPEPEAY